MRSLVTMFVAFALTCAPAMAATISNCDETPHTVTINNAGEMKQFMLPVGGTVESTGPMVSASVDKGPFVRMQMRDVYCVRKGALSLQMRRPYTSKRQ